MAASIYTHEGAGHWGRKAYLGDGEPTPSESPWTWMIARSLPVGGLFCCC